MTANILTNIPLGMESLIDSLFLKGALLGWTLLKAFLVFIIGRLLIALLKKLLKRVLDRKNPEPSIRSFTESLVNVVLILLLIISVIGTLGIQTTSFAALLASAGVAIGMALSGNLSNFAGGLIILLFKPFKVGDYIEAQGIGGEIKEIQIFHTILTTADNKTIYIPNGLMSSGTVTNFSQQSNRRIEWIFSVDYGEDYERVKQAIESVLATEKRILPSPEPLIALHALGASSVNIIVRVWVNKADYWPVYFDINRAVYETFNAQKIDFPFPQLTVHSGK